MKDPRRRIAKFIEDAYGDGLITRGLPLWRYEYCGSRLDEMSVEEASNVVQTKLTYAA